MAEARHTIPSNGDGNDASDASGATGNDGASPESGGALDTFDPSERIPRPRGRPRLSDSEREARNAARREARNEGKSEGKSTAKNATNLNIDTSGIESILFSLHTMAGAFVAEAALSHEDAAKLASALVAVNSHYANVINPKVVAWVNLASIGAGIYGPRVLAFGIRKRMERQAVRPRITAPVMANVPRGTPANDAPAPTAQRPRGEAPRPAMSPTLKEAYSDPTFVAMPGADDA